MKNVPDLRDPNKVWYLHVNGLHFNEYESLHTCLVDAIFHVQIGSEIHIQTRQQWLDEVDEYDYDNAYNEGYEAAKQDGL